MSLRDHKPLPPTYHIAYTSLREVTGDKLTGLERGSVNVDAEVINERPNLSVEASLEAVRQNRKSLAEIDRRNNTKLMEEVEIAAAHERWKREKQY